MFQPLHNIHPDVEMKVHPRRELPHIFIPPVLLLFSFSRNEGTPEKGIATLFCQKLIDGFLIVEMKVHPRRELPHYFLIWFLLYFDVHECRNEGTPEKGIATFGCFVVDNHFFS